MRIDLDCFGFRTDVDEEEEFDFLTVNKLVRLVVLSRNQLDSRFLGVMNPAEVLFSLSSNGILESIID